MMFGFEAARKLVKEYEFENVLDIGSGSRNDMGSASRYFESFGKEITRQDINPDYDPDILGDFNQIAIPDQYDCIWCSHVLEHQLNVHDFLVKLYHTCKTDGVVAITVPPLKHQIVGGHVTLWNGGLLLYNMILAGFDCSKASVTEYDYNISVIVKKQRAELPDLKYDAGDILALQRFFPLPFGDGFDGRLTKINW
jgi:hypothetical protein